MGTGRWWKQELVKVFHLGIWVFCSFIDSITSLASNTHIYPPGGESAAQPLATPSPSPASLAFLESLWFQSPCQMRIKPAFSSSSKVNMWIGLYYLAPWSTSCEPDALTEQLLGAPCNLVRRTYDTCKGDTQKGNFQEEEAHADRGLCMNRASLVAQMVKNLPAMQEIQVLSLGQEDCLEEEMATHSSILAYGIPWTEEPVRLQSMGSQKDQTRLSD